MWVYKQEGGIVKEQERVTKTRRIREKLERADLTIQKRGRLVFVNVVHKSRQ